MSRSFWVESSFCLFSFHRLRARKNHFLTTTTTRCRYSSGAIRSAHDSSFNFVFAAVVPSVVVKWNNTSEESLKSRPMFVIDQPLTRRTILGGFYIFGSITNWIHTSVVVALEQWESLGMASTNDGTESSSFINCQPEPEEKKRSRNRSKYYHYPVGPQCRLWSEEGWEPRNQGERI